MPPWATSASSCRTESVRAALSASVKPADEFVHDGKCSSSTNSLREPSLRWTTVLSMLHGARHRSVSSCSAESVCQPRTSSVNPLHALRVFWRVTPGLLFRTETAFVEHNLAPWTPPLSLCSAESVRQARNHSVNPLRMLRELREPLRELREQLHGLREPFRMLRELRERLRGLHERLRELREHPPCAPWAPWAPSVGFAHAWGYSSGRKQRSRGTPMLREPPPWVRAARRAFVKHKLAPWTPWTFPQAEKRFLSVS